MSQSILAAAACSAVTAFARFPCSFPFLNQSSTSSNTSLVWDLQPRPFVPMGSAPTAWPSKGQGKRGAPGETPKSPPQPSRVHIRDHISAFEPLVEELSSPAWQPTARSWGYSQPPQELLWLLSSESGLSPVERRADGVCIIRQFFCLRSCYLCTYLQSIVPYFHSIYVPSCLRCYLNAWRRGNYVTGKAK